MLGTDVLTVKSDDSAPAAPANTAATARLRNFEYGCQPDGKGGTDYTLHLDIMASKPLENVNLKTLELPYFIGIVTPDENVLQRSAFTTKMTFDDTGVATTKDKHQLHIPADLAAAAKYKIAIGFILTPQQMEDNRRQAAGLIQKAPGDGKEKTGKKNAR